jgi:hypothetical protein
MSADVKSRIYSGVSEYGPANAQSQAWPGADTANVELGGCTLQVQ